jgi:nucleotide-binding universal stress UspA family protein
MFSKILVPLDGSKLAARILPQVELLAQCTFGQVTLMTVGDSETPEVPTAKYLEETAKALKAKGLNVNWVYRTGDPAKEIIAYAAANKMDLIALASHGASEILWVLGSVAEKVISHATVPTLILRVMEVKPPGHKDKDEMWYSLQTP